MRRINNVCWLLWVAMLLVTCDTERNVAPGFPDFFIKYYGGNGDQSGVDLAQDVEGNFLLLGNSENSKGKKFFVAKIDSTGKILTQKYFGDPSSSIDEEAVDIEPSYDGNFIIAIQKRVSATERDIKLLQISPQLVGLDSITRSFPGDDEIKSITTLSGAQRGFLMTGSTTANLTDDGLSDVTDPFIFRVNESLTTFDPLWNTAGGGGQYDTGIKIYEYKGTNPLVAYVLFFSSNPSGTGGDLDFYSIGIQEDGNGEGSRKPLSGPNDTDEALSQVIEAPNLGYVLVGTTSIVGGQKSIYNALLDLQLSGSSVNQGNEVVTAGLTGDLSGISACATSTGGYLLLGNQEVTENNSVNSNLILIKLDIRGVPQWTSSFGADYFDESAKVIELSNGKIMILGTVTLGNQEKMVLIKVNDRGQFAP